MNLPDVGGEPTKRAVSAVHASTRCFHSNTCSISPQFNALDDSFQHNVAGALDVRRDTCFTSTLSTSSATTQSRLRHR